MVSRVWWRGGDLPDLGVALILTASPQLQTKQRNANKPSTSFDSDLSFSIRLMYVCPHSPQKSSPETTPIPIPDSRPPKGLLWANDTEIRKADVKSIQGGEFSIDKPSFGYGSTLGTPKVQLCILTKKSGSGVK